MRSLWMLPSYEYIKYVRFKCRLNAILNISFHFFYYFSTAKEHFRFWIENRMASTRLTEKQHRMYSLFLYTVNFTIL